MAYEQDQGNRSRSQIPSDRLASAQQSHSGSDGRTVHHDPENARDDADSKRIQHDIDRTRASMDDTLERLGQRLNPSHLVDSVAEWFAGSDTPTGTHGQRDDTIRRASRNAADTAWQKIRANPLAAAGIGAAIGWLLLKSDHQDNGYRSSESSSQMRERIMRNSREPQPYGGSYVDARTGEPYDPDTYANEGQSPSESQSGMGGRLSNLAGDAASKAADGLKGAAGYVAEKLGDAASAVGGAAKSAASSTGDALSSAGHRASEMASSKMHSGQHSAQDMYGSARDGASSALHRGQEQFHRAVDSHPLAIGIAALAAGVLAGLAVPETRRERQLMGEQSRRLRSAIDEEAHREGVAPDQLREQASSLFDEAKDATSQLVDSAKQRADDVLDPRQEGTSSSTSEADQPTAWKAQDMRQ